MKTLRKWLAGYEGIWWMGASLLFIAPFLAMSAFDHPVNDDYCYAVLLRDHGLMGTILYAYKNWTGRLGACLSLGINPLLTGNLTVFKFFVFSYILLFIWAFYLFIFRLFNGAITRPLSALIAFFFCGLYFAEMPSPQQGLFWYNGAISYLFPVIYLSLGFILFSSGRDGWERILGRLGAMVLIFWAVTSNEIYAVITMYFIFIAYLVDYKNKKKSSLWISAFLLVAIAGVIVMKFAPGNSVRQSTISAAHVGDMKFATVKAIKKTVFFLYKWVASNELLWILSIMTIPLASRIFVKGRNAIFSISPIVPLLTLPMISGLFALFFWVSGDSAVPTRFSNITYLLFLIGWFHVLLILVSKWHRSEREILEVPAFVRIVLFVLLLLNLKDGNTRIAYIDLLSGRAKRYDQELKERYTQIGKSTDKVIKVSALKSMPQTLYGADIEPDPTGWENKCYSEYFKKDSIFIYN